MFDLHSDDQMKLKTGVQEHHFALANGPPSKPRIDALNTTATNFADKPTLANAPPVPPSSESRIDPLNTSTQNLADKHTSGPEWTPSESRIDAT